MLSAVNDPDGIWTTLERLVKKRNLDIKVKKEVLALLDYEKSKRLTKYGLANGPFDIPANADPKLPFNKFVFLLDRLKGKKYEKRLKGKKYEDDAEFIENTIIEIQKVFSLRKLKIHGQEVQLKDHPIDDSGTVHVTAKTIHRYGQKHLALHWADVAKMYVIQIKNEDGREILKKQTPRHQLQVNVEGKGTTFTVKVATKETENDVNMDTIRGLLVLSPDEDKTVNKHRMNPSNSLYDIDRFRIEICDKYKTLYDLFELFQIPSDITFKEVCKVFANDAKEFEDQKNAGNSVKWEHLDIPKSWKTLLYQDKVLIILLHQIDEALLRAPDAFLNNQLATLYDADLMNVAYAVDPAKGGSQRVLGEKRRRVGTSATQLSSTFANEGKRYKAEHIKSIVEQSGWRASKKYFTNHSVVYGRRYHDFLYLDNRKEREACARLRRIDRILRLSHERGYPVLEKNVINPYPHTMTTSTARMTAFGVNNYDRTSGLPALQRAPLVIAGKSDVSDSIQTIEDPQKMFDRRGLTKPAQLVDVLVETKDEKIYYNHPIYRCKAKKEAYRELQSFMTS